MTDEPIFEVQVRAFYTSENADVVPAVILLLQKQKDKPPDWGEVMQEAVRSLSQQILGAPQFASLRPMTHAEINDFREEERKE